MFLLGVDIEGKVWSSVSILSLVVSSQWRKGGRKARESKSRQETRTGVSLMGIGCGQGGQPGTMR